MGFGISPWQNYAIRDHYQGCRYSSILWIDANENLWVTNIGGESVTEYLYGSKTPHIIITEVCRIRLASQSTGLTICM